MVIQAINYLKKSNLRLCVYDYLFTVCRTVVYFMMSINRNNILKQNFSLKNTTFLKKNCVM